MSRTADLVENILKSKQPALGENSTPSHFNSHFLSEIDRNLKLKFPVASVPKSGLSLVLQKKTLSTTDGLCLQGANNAKFNAYDQKLHNLEDSSLLDNVTSLQVIWSTDVLDSFGLSVLLLNSNPFSKILSGFPSIFRFHYPILEPTKGKRPHIVTNGQPVFARSHRRHPDI
nr:hypothetical protein HmN_000275000 [Hymenolepis microstoma]